jgi:chorismate-pyruvate lyase
MSAHTSDPNLEELVSKYNAIHNRLSAGGTHPMSDWIFRRCSLTAVLRIFTEDVRAKILEQEREIIVKNAKSVTTQVVSGFLMRALQD